MQWDTAAGDAILRAAGGTVVTLDGTAAHLRSERRARRRGATAIPGSSPPAASTLSPEPVAPTEILFHQSPVRREIAWRRRENRLLHAWRRRALWLGSARRKPGRTAARCTDPPVPPPPPRSRGDLHHARGGRHLRAAGHALFDRQGFLGDAASGAEGLLSGAAAVPAAPRRHDLEVPRDDRASATRRRRNTASICSSTPTRTASRAASTRSTTARRTTPR